MKVKPVSSPISEIDFHSVEITSDVPQFIKIDNVPEIENESFVQAYAIDPTKFKFTTAVVTVIAKGSILMKCKDWDFANRVCLGDWAELQAITPGEPYTFTLTPEDPGYAEYNYTTYPTTTIAGQNAYASANAGAKPPAAGPAVQNEAEFTSAQYGAINASDDSWANTTANNLYRTHRFLFNITPPRSAITQINISWEGYDTGGNLATRRVDLYAWNFTSGSWGTSLASGNDNADQMLLAGLNSGLTDYINSAGAFTFMIESATSGGTFTLYTDYTFIKIAYDSPPNATLVSPANGNITTSNNITFTCNVSDDIQLANTTFYWNYTGSFIANGTNTITGLSNQTTFSRTNLSNGQYLWNCYTCDNASQCSFTPANWTVTVNYTATPNQAPQINLNLPGNNTQFNNAQNIDFNFTATDDYNTVFSCGIYLDNALNQTNTSTINNTLTNFLINGISYGSHNWKVNCTDGSLSNASEMRYFNITDTLKPQIMLNYPPPDSHTGSAVNFNWTATDNADTSLLCDLTIDSIVNASNVASANNTAVNHTVSNITGESHQWNVTCIDDSANTNTSETRTFTIDTISPKWSNPQKNETTVYWNSTIYFNATWTDNLNLSGYIFLTNQTGSWINSTFVPFSGVSNTSENISSITASVNATVEWYFWANDTSGNYNQTDVQSFVVQARPTMVTLSTDNETYPQGKYPGGGYEINITFNAGYIDNISGLPISGANCSVLNNQSSSQAAIFDLPYNASSGNYTGNLSTFDLYDTVGFNVTCSKTNYNNATNTTTANVWWYGYLWEFTNQTYDTDKWSTYYLRNQPITAGTPYARTYDVSLSSGLNLSNLDNLIDTTIYCDSNIDCGFVNSFLFTPPFTMRLNMSINDTTCKPVLCKFDSPHIWEPVHLDCGSPVSIPLPNTSMLVESNYTGIETRKIDSGFYLGMALYLNCTAPVDEQVNLYYNYTDEPANLVIPSAQRLTSDGTMVKSHQLDSGYTLGPNSTANSTRTYTINFNNSRDTASQDRYIFLSRILAFYPNSIVPNTTYVYNSTFGLLASDNATAGPLSIASVSPPNEISWTTEIIPAFTSINETVNSLFLNSIRDEDVLVSNTTISKIWNLTIISILTQDLQVNNLTIWTNYSTYGVRDDWNITVSKIMSGVPVDITGQCTFNANNGTIILPAVNVSRLDTYEITATNSPPEVTINWPHGETRDAPDGVTISINASDPDGINSSIAQVTLPNSTVENITLEPGQQSDNFDSNTMNSNWFVENTLLGPGQTCIADIDTTIPGQAYSSLSGTGGPEIDTFCTIISQKAIYGDFDLNVSFDITNFGQDTALKLILSEHPPTVGINDMVFLALSNWKNRQKKYEIYADDENFSNYVGWRASNDTSGKMRIKRVNNNFTFYTWNNTNNSWTEETISKNEFNLNTALYISFESEAVYPSWGTIRAGWNDFAVQDTNSTFAIFNDTTAVGTYNVRIFVNDSLGAVNGSETTNFSVANINDRPPAPFLLAPWPGDTFGGVQDIVWAPVYDEEGDSLQFNITLLNPADLSFNKSIVTDYGNSATISYSWNTSAGGYADGIYGLNVTVFENETAEKYDNTNIPFGNITVDNTLPDIQFVSPTESSDTILNRNYLLINVTASDSNFHQINIDLFNATASLGCFMTTTNSSFANFTDLANGIFFFNATAIDLAGNENSTETRNITINITGTAPTPPGGGTNGPQLTEGQIIPAETTPAAGILITINDTATINLKGNTDLTQIYVGVFSPVTALFNVVELKDKPQTIPSLEEPDYKYWQLLVPDLPENNIQKATIKFRVAKDWIAQNNINQSTVAMYRWTDKWNDLPTSQISEDDKYVFYEAETPGFSLFGVSAKVLSPIIPPAIVKFGIPSIVILILIAGLLFKMLTTKKCQS